VPVPPGAVRRRMPYLRQGDDVILEAPVKTEPGVRQLARLLLPLGGITALVSTAVALTSPFLSLFLSRELGADPWHTGLFLFLTPLAAVVVATVLGRMSDGSGSRTLLLIGSSAAGCCAFVLFAVLRSYWLLLVVSVTLSAIGGSLVPQVLAAGRRTVDRVGSGRAPMAMNWLRMITSMAWVTGPSLAGALLGWIDFTGLFAATAICFALGGVVAGIWVREPGTPRAGPVAEENPPAAALSEPTPAPAGTVPLAAVAFVLMQCAVVLNVQAMPLFFSDDLHGTVRGAGVVLGSCAALEIPLMACFGALVGRLPLRRLVVLGGLSGVAYNVVVTAAGDIWQVAAAQILNACFIAAAVGLGISLFQDLMPGRPGRATALYTNTNRVSSMIAGLVLGLAQHFGYRLAYGMGAVLCACGLAVLAGALALERRHTNPIDASPVNAVS
jgi:MFS transporter, SET family, sugar efflux transporter